MSDAQLSASEELRIQARQQHIAGNTVEAIQLLTQAIQQDPSNTQVAMDMVQVFIDIGETDQAASLYNRLPDADKQSDVGRTLSGQLTFIELASKTDGKHALQSRVNEDAEDYDALFDLAICLLAENDFEQAVDHLITIHQKSPDYKEGAAREMIITLSNMIMINDPERAAAFRRRLGNVNH